jgi:hypothetical protein
VELETFTVTVLLFQAATVKLSLGEVVTDATVPTTTGRCMIATLMAVAASVPVDVP